MSGDTGHEDSGRFTAGEQWQIVARIRSKWLRAVADVDPRSLLIPAASVLAIAASEAALLSKPSVWRTQPGFIFQYARYQLLPSIIWATKPADQIATRLGYDAQALLRQCDPTVKADAARLLHIQTLQSARSVIAGFVGIAQILRLADLVSEAQEAHVARVLACREPLLSGVRGRVVRLSGRSSDVTELTAQRLGSHIVPIVEEPRCQAVAPMIALHTSNGQRPFAWHVANKAYGKAESWGAASVSVQALAEAAFQLDREWLYEVRGSVEGNASKSDPSTKASDHHRPKTPTPKVLILEADSSVGEQALALGTESANDLSVQEASQGFFMLEELARAQGETPCPLVHLSTCPGPAFVK